MKKLAIFLGIISSFYIISCNDNNDGKTSNGESSSNAINDPNEVKPMALMMRTMANYCDSMRVKLNNGESVDSVTYPLMPFWTAEPTDSSVLEELFYNNAKQFQTAYRKLMYEEKNQKENYTAVINQCVNCHSSYCMGPLKRIMKLPLDYKE
jgi:thioredoxin-related protein